MLERDAQGGRTKFSLMWWKPIPEIWRSMHSNVYCCLKRIALMTESPSFEFKLVWPNNLAHSSIVFIKGLVYVSTYIGIDSSAAMALIPYASDVMTLSIPYLVIALNRSVRTLLFRLFNCFKVNSAWGSPVGAEGASDSRIAVGSLRISHNIVSGVVNIKWLLKLYCVNQFALEHFKFFKLLNPTVFFARFFL